MKIIDAKKKHMDSIAELYKELANFHRKIDKYYRPGNKETQKEFKKDLLKNFRKIKRTKIYFIPVYYL